MWIAASALIGFLLGVITTFAFIMYGSVKPDQSSTKKGG